VTGRPVVDDPVVADLLSRATFPAGTSPLRCAVSGGPDSTALLALAVALGRAVTVVHVDHGLRPESTADADQVSRLATEWGAEFELHRIRVPDGGDLEARARAARHAAVGPQGLWGHTADDQAETVILRLLRGTGPHGLAAIRPDRHPLLLLRRAETVALCRHLGVRPVDDVMNRDPRFDRARVRHEVLPLLGDVARRDVVPALARLARQSAELDDLVELLSAEVDATSVGQLRSVPRPVAVAAWRRWWTAATGGLPPPDAAAIERVLSVVEGRARACDVTAGWSLRRRQGVLRLVDGRSNGTRAPVGGARRALG
jgi:tRNA(Ile)-lysidine synthase